MEESIKAYIAGIIDGEGSIMLNKSRKNEFRVPFVSVSSTTPEILDFLKFHCSGTICSHKTYKEHHKPHWSWRISHNTALSLLEQIVNFLLVPEKLFRAKYLLDGYKKVTPRNGKYTTEMLVAKHSFEDNFFYLIGGLAGIRKPGPYTID